MNDEAGSVAHGDGTRPLPPPDAASSPNTQTHLSPSPSIASSKLSSRSWLSSVRRPKTAPGPKAPQFKRTLLSDDDARRDSALTACLSTPPNDRTTENPVSDHPSLHSAPSLPAIVVQDELSGRRSLSGSNNIPAEGTPRSLEDNSLQAQEDAFRGIETVIPTGGLEDLASPSKIEFSNRGSMLLGGQRANTMLKQLESQLAAVEEGKPATPPQPPSSPPSPPRANDLSVPAQVIRRSPSRLSTRSRMGSLRVLSADEMLLSRKVRTMYRHGNEKAANWDDMRQVSESEQSGVAESSRTHTPHTLTNGSTLTVDHVGYGETSSLRETRRQSMIPKEATEAAGGVEDWADMEGGEVDRYGFIIPKKQGPRDANDPSKAPEVRGIQRVSTALHLASEEPRRRRIGRSASKARSEHPSASTPPKRHESHRSITAASMRSNRTTSSRIPAQNPFRYAINRLPHNKDRRWLDEASDMLTLPPGLQEIAEKEEGGKATAAMKAKEMEREEKWRRMAKVVRGGSEKGGGMMFEFDTKDPKLISRTWKGIPDRWRATAWYAFLAASARADKNSPTDEELIEGFYELQEESSADDMQIDMDVPRTINRHIMFRRRYRGGQRLLFRVLHAISLYLPDTGYVQGMAALAATLLCYYEEDKAFVMLVRLWQYRGLEKLYESGFAGLMEALDDFEKNWLRGGGVAKKLEELGVSSTAYGTRWYLTLFNYSLPFPAQLRVWDVFMLLGDAANSSSTPNATCSGDLDPLHATSAALIDATREILLDSDFENAMKVLTSWIPVKDEDLLMKVAKAEYKARKKRGNSGAAS